MSVIKEARFASPVASIKETRFIIKTSTSGRRLMERVSVDSNRSAAPKNRAPSTVKTESWGHLFPCSSTSISVSYQIFSVKFSLLLILHSFALQKRSWPVIVQFEQRQSN